jgi:hypothetical protein
MRWEKRKMRKSIILTAIAVFCLVTAAADATNFLEEEAGICAYTNTERSIDMARVKPLYRTIEYETDEYIIGSVPIGEYPETEDVHVYASKDGWIAAYYPANDPVSKMIDWNNYQGGQLTSTKLELALKKVSDTLNFPLVEVKYYDFVTPRANKLLIVIDREDTNYATDSFEIMIPDDVTIYERSWGLYAFNAYVTLYIDEEKIHQLKPPRGVWHFAHQKLTPNQLQQGIYHSVKTYLDEHTGSGWGAAGLVLVYREQ